MIGNIVTVKVDRPMGSYHPKHKDMYYTINYGYIESFSNNCICNCDNLYDKIAPDNASADDY